MKENLLGEMKEILQVIKMSTHGEKKVWMIMIGISIHGEKKEVKVEKKRILVVLIITLIIMTETLWD